MSVSRWRHAWFSWLTLAVLLGTLGCGTWRAARLYQSGTQALDAGSPARAIAELEAAAGLEPRRSEIRNHLGLAYAVGGDAVAAERSFEAAIALDCDNAAAQRNLLALRAGQLGPQSVPGGDEPPTAREAARWADPEER